MRANFHAIALKQTITYSFHILLSQTFMITIIISDYVLHTRVYQKVSELAVWSEKCKC
jgi:hypothetical protein